MAEQYKIAQPKEYYNKFLEKDVRPDSRELGEFRPTVLNIGCITTAEGSSLVKLGNTSVICGIKAEIAEPNEHEKKGYLVPNVELSPLCSTNFKPGPPSELAQVLSQNMSDFLSDSRCINLEDLCIFPGKFVWSLYIDLVCLDYDGNVMDACTLALVAALKNILLPLVTVDEESGELKTDTSIHQVLTVNSCPVSTSFIIFDNKILLVDPTREEEEFSTGALTIIIEGKNLCSIYKPGGTPLTDTQINTCIERAFERGREVERLINRTIMSIES